MSQKKSRSRVLRQLAEDFLRRMAQMAGEDELPSAEQAELANSLVRQWITYEGNATLLMDDQQVYLVLGRTPLGKPCIIPEPVAPGWWDRLIEDWKLEPEQLREAFEQLNLGQSAEVTNRDGLPLRLWVNPKERSRGVEPLVNQPVEPGRKRDYHKIATDIAGQTFGRGVDAEERKALIGSVAQQWMKYQGHACLFVGREQIVITLTEEQEGGCQVNTRHILTEIEPLLCSLGFSPEVVPDVLARINLDQEIEFQDNKGGRSRLHHDPRTRRIRVQTLRTT